jgi:uncharacterized membrane protein YcaP (DUF421 family)
MTPADLVVILLIANAVQNAMTGPDTSLSGGLIAAAVILALNRAITRLRARYPSLERLLYGAPTVLVRDGRVLTANLQREHIEQDEIEMAMREHGVESLSDVKTAVLELDGTISIIQEDKAAIRVRRRVRQFRRQ